MNTYEVKLYVGERCVAEATTDARNIDEAQRNIENFYGVKATSAHIKRF